VPWDVVFEIEGQHYSLPEELATLLADNLLFLTKYAEPPDDEEQRVLARLIEAALVDPEAGPVQPSPWQLVLLLDRVDSLTANGDESALRLFQAIREALSAN
jgi:hypothetical protein